MLNPLQAAALPVQADAAAAGGASKRACLLLHPNSILSLLCLVRLELQKSYKLNGADGQLSSTT